MCLLFLHFLFQNVNRGNGRAPVIYMLLYENPDVTVCVFILRKGNKMPMHDHPGMRGILKVSIIIIKFS